jgi:hypothetical protein
MPWLEDPQRDHGAAIKIDSVPIRILQLRYRGKGVEIDDQRRRSRSAAT